MIKILKWIFITFAGFIGFVIVIGVIAVNSSSDKNLSKNTIAEPPPNSIPLTVTNNVEYARLLKDYRAIEKSLTCNIDKFQRAKFCTIRGEPLTGIGAYLSVREVDKDRIPGCSMRFTINYHGESWIFFKRAIVLNDGNPHEYVLSEHPKQDISMHGGGVTESYDVFADKNEITTLALIAAAKKSEVRLDGEKIKEFTVPQNVRKGIQNMFKAVQLCKSDKG